MLSMIDQTESEPTESSTIKKVLKLTADYFLYSDKKLKAWFLLISTIFAVMAIVALTALLTWWSLWFWAALMAKDLILIMTSMLIFGGIILGYMCANAVKNYFSEALSIEWRTWLIEKFLILKTPSSEIKQKQIQDNVTFFTEKTISIGLDFLRSSLSLGLFIGILWVVGGALSFIVFGTMISIPGYLVWVALIVALITAGIKRLISAYLPELNSKQLQLETDFLNADNAQEKKAISEELYDTAYKKLSLKTVLAAIGDFCAQIPIWLPYLAGIPLFFLGQIQMIQLLQIGVSFGVVSESVDKFVNSNELLSDYVKHVNNIFELDQPLETELNISNDIGDVQNLYGRLKAPSENTNLALHHEQSLVILPSKTKEESIQIDATDKENEGFISKLSGAM